MRRTRQLEFDIRTHGGRRRGAGRPRTTSQRNVPHRPREPHRRHAPVHATLRATQLPASLRSPTLFSAVRDALARASRDTFRIVAFSVQGDHVHLLVEADAAVALARGLQGLAIRAAKAVNRALGRSGTVWADRFHARDLTTPLAVRHALVYVLQNHRKHGRDPGARLDPCSSAASFEGWKNPQAERASSAPVVTARTWLARWGWRRHGLLDVRERPRHAAGP